MTASQTAANLDIGGMKKYLLIVIILVIAGIATAAIFILLNKKEPAPATNQETKTNTSVQSKVTTTVAGLGNLGDTIEPKEIVDIGNQADEIVQQGESAIEPLLAQTTHQDLVVRWFAVSSLVQLGQEVDTANQEKIVQGLETLIAKETNAALKSQAATGLVALGEKSAIPTVIDCLGGEEALLFSEPPELLSDFCLKALAYYTGRDLLSDKAEWQSWWQENQAKLVWDQKQKKFITQ